MIRFLLVLLTAGLLFIGCEPEKPKPVTTEELIKMRPGMIKILFQNEYVLVTKMSIKSGDAIPVHRESGRILLAEDDCELEIVEGDKKPVRKQFAKDEFAWYDAMVHSLRNPGSKDINMYIITRKNTSLPVIDSPAQEAGKSPAVRRLLQNDQVSVSEVFLAAGKSSASQAGHYRMVYAMSEFQLQHTSADGTTETNLKLPGQFHWHHPDLQQIENVGETDARYLVFEFLK